MPKARKGEVLPRISHAYAGTAYSVQGRTAEACVYFGATASDARELYVGLTRHRQDAWLIVERERLEAAEKTRNGDLRIKPSVAELHERLFVEARRYAEKTNVVDHNENRTAFVRTGVIPAPQPDARLDLRRGFEAGRALRALLREIGAAPRIVLWQLGRLRREAEQTIADRYAAIAKALRKAGPSRTLDTAPTPLRSGLEIDR